MTDAPDDPIAALEERIDALHDEIETCRKAILVSRVSFGAGALWLAATLFGLAHSTIGALLAVAACLGGIIGAGANTATRRNAAAALARCTAERDALIDALRLRSL